MPLITPYNPMIRYYEKEVECDVWEYFFSVDVYGLNELQELAKFVHVICKCERSKISGNESFLDLLILCVYACVRDAVVYR